MSFAPLLLGVGGALLNGIGKVVEGRANAKALEFQAGISEMNRRIAEAQAERSLERGAVEQQEVDFTNLAHMGQQRAIQGSSGVAINSGSAVKARANAAVLARLDALRVREGAAQEAYGHRVSALGFKMDTELKMKGAKQSRVAGWLGAAGSLITGAARVGGSMGGGGGSFSSLVA